jgi:hypothetical protein
VSFVTRDVLRKHADLRTEYEQLKRDSSLETNDLTMSSEELTNGGLMRVNRILTVAGLVGSHSLNPASTLVNMTILDISGNYWIYLS